MTVQIVIRKGTDVSMLKKKSLGDLDRILRRIEKVGNLLEETNS